MSDLVDPKRPHVRAARDGLGFWPVDWCHFVFLTGSIILFMILWSEKPDKIFDPVGWSLVDLALLVVLFVIVKKSAGWKLLRAALMRMLFAALTIPLVFTQLGSLVPHVNPSNWEEKLRAFDIALFSGTEPLTALEAWNHPWLTEFLTWIYNYYYFIAIIVGVAVVKEKRPRVLARVTFAFVLCIYLSYVGYYVVPATGPNHLSEYSAVAAQHVGEHAAELYRFDKPLDGVWLTREMRKTMYFIEKIKQDCFPSGHTAVALLALLLALRYARQLVWALTPLVIGLIFSTVYLRYHYVADVVAGILLAVLSSAFGLRLHEYFERKVWGSDGNEVERVDEALELIAGSESVLEILALNEIPQRRAYFNAVSGLDSSKIVKALAKLANAAMLEETDGLLFRIVSPEDGDEVKGRIPPERRRQIHEDSLDWARSEDTPDPRFLVGHLIGAERHDEAARMLMGLLREEQDGLRAKMWIARLRLTVDALLDQEEKDSSLVRSAGLMLIERAGSQMKSRELTKLNNRLKELEMSEDDRLLFDALVEQANQARAADAAARNAEEMADAAAEAAEAESAEEGGAQQA